MTRDTLANINDDGKITARITAWIQEDVEKYPNDVFVELNRGTCWEGEYMIGRDHLESVRDAIDSYLKQKEA